MRIILTIVSLCLAVCLHAQTSTSGSSANTDSAGVTVRVLQELTVAGALQPISQHGDTLVYNVAAFDTPEGARLRELLRRLPGIEIEADGTIVAQGKAVSALLLNGRDFFSGNRSLVLDNLPVEVLVSISVYERVLPDDEDLGVRTATERVLDLTTDENGSRGWMGDANAGGGHEQRYLGNLSMSQFDDKWQNMLSVAADNLPQGFGIGDSYYDKLDHSIPTADSHHQEYGLLLGRQSKLWNVSGSAFYSPSHSVKGSHSFTENLSTATPLLHTATTDGSDHDRTATATLHIERRDSMTTFVLDPHFSWSRNTSSSNYMASTTDGRILTNEQFSSSSDRSRATGTGLSARLRRRLSRHGRAVTATASWSYDDSRQTSHTTTITDYVRTLVSERQDRLIDAPERQEQWQMRLTYVEPLTPQLKLLAEYGLSRRHETTSQPVIADGIYCDSLSRYANRTIWSHTPRLLLQFSPREELAVNIGAQANPVTTDTRYVRHHLRVDTTRTVHGWSPEVNIYYRNQHGWNITAQYQGNTHNVPLLCQLPITDDTDPLLLRVGNPGLRPSFVHQLTTTFFWFEPTSQTQLSLQGQYIDERQALAEIVSYDPVRGIRRQSWTNVDGTRHVAASWTLATAFQPDSKWSLDLQGNVSQSRRISVHESGMEIPHRHLQLRQFAAVQWQPSVFTLRPYAYCALSHLREDTPSTVAPTSADADLWTYGRGMVLRLDTESGWSAAMDAGLHSRRGYAEAINNDDEWLVDAEVAYSFLRGRVAELRLQACDLLHQRTLARVATTATERVSATYQYSVTHYILLTFTYRFSLMGGGI